MTASSPPIIVRDEGAVFFRHWINCSLSSLMLRVSMLLGKEAYSSYTSNE